VPNKTKIYPKSLCTWASKSKTKYLLVKSITSLLKMVPKENSLKMLKNRNNQIVADLSKFIEKMKGIKRFFEY
jgi:hypothetical protein